MNRRIIFMGTPSFAVASLNALLAANMEVVAVVTAPDRPAGRGRKLRMSAVKERATELELPVLQPSNLKDPEFHAQLDAFDASLFVVVAFRMLPESVWRRPEHGTVNLHASLLPDYRGAAPINWAIINGEKRTGITTFRINERIDTGDILLREVLEIGSEENAGALHDRLMEAGAELLLKTIKDIFDGTVNGVPQEQFVGDDAHKAPKLTPTICRINWALPAKAVHDLVRGLAPHPGAWSLWQEPEKPERQIKVLAARMGPAAKRKFQPGTVSIEDGSLMVHCGDRPIEVMELQMQGKKAMEAGAFIRGLRATEGIRVE